MSERRTASARRTASRTIALTSSGVLLALALPATAATAAPGNACDNRSNNNYEKLLECVTLDGVREHLEAFQKIADNPDELVYPGSRAAGTEGYAQSVEYVSGLLEDAGYEVTLTPVEFTYFYPSKLTQLTPAPAADYENAVATGSGSETVNGPVIPVDVNLAGDRANTSACEVSDFAGLDFGGENDIALVQRGTCNFEVKARNAEAAGAEAVVIFNQGNTAAPDRQGVVNPTLGTFEATKPVVGTTYAAGVALARPGSTALVEVLDSEPRTDYNVIAELPGKNTENVVMAGAHLDSVPAGPGINDNGSGSAALLETALLMAKSNTPNTLRFAWWAAEEEGLLGSTAYVNSLSEEERDRIALYMNYDMVASPNYFLGVYDADESTFPAPVVVPEGSEAIEDVYESYYTKVDQPYDDSEFSGRSDYQAFIVNGIPSGGLFTGAEVVKTPQQAAIWGGTAGQSFDPCYHQKCDDIDNLALDALEVNSDLIAFTMLHFGYSTESVNGVQGKKVPGPAFDLPAPAGPEGTFAEGGGGLHHDHEGASA